MDKFGIFELLDTLSEIAASVEEADSNKQEVPAPRPSPDDKAFLPPSLNGEQLPDEQKLQRNALKSLYERHESISKRIDKKQ